MRAPIDPPAIIREARAEHRCFCSECLALDLRFPGAGYQLTFWRYRPGGPMRLTRPTLEQR